VPDLQQQLEQARAQAALAQMSFDLARDAFIAAAMGCVKHSDFAGTVFFFVVIVYLLIGLADLAKGLRLVHKRQRRGCGSRSPQGERLRRWR
jgi:hypothetical protein